MITWTAPARAHAGGGGLTCSGGGLIPRRIPRKKRYPAPPVVGMSTPTLSLPSPRLSASFFLTAKATFAAHDRDHIGETANKPATMARERPIRPALMRHDRSARQTGKVVSFLVGPRVVLPRPACHTFSPSLDTPAHLASILERAVPVPGEVRDIRILPGIAQRDRNARCDAGRRNSSCSVFSAYMPPAKRSLHAWHPFEVG
jgi:hypothetical protein